MIVPFLIASFAIIALDCFFTPLHHDQGGRLEFLGHSASIPYEVIRYS